MLILRVSKAFLKCLRTGEFSPAVGEPLPLACKKGDIK